ncbi:hypothetical protein ACFSTC_41255 [Nonomuraea ferruginea]
MYELGVRSMFACHKYDNALCGVRFDSGTQGAIVNIGNLLGTGRFWQARTCTTAEHDNTIEPAGVLPGQIARLLPPGVSLPIYPAAPHCNTRGLTSLGQYMIEGMMRRGMMIEVDHMSVKAADSALDLLEAAGYPGVISSHSWTDPHYLDRIYALGGMVTQYGHDAEHFVDEWRRTEPLRQAHQVPGYGYGLDANGMGRLPAPRAEQRVEPGHVPLHLPRRRHPRPPAHRRAGLGRQPGRRRELRPGARLDRGHADHRRPGDRPGPGRSAPSPTSAPGPQPPSTQASADTRPPTPSPGVGTPATGHSTR